MMYAASGSLMLPKLKCAWHAAVYVICTEFRQSPSTQSRVSCWQTGRRTTRGA